MGARQRIAAHLVALLVGSAALVAEAGPIRNQPRIIGEIAFVGLRRISPESLKDKMICREGQALSADSVAHDVRTLGGLGWFDTVRVESDEAGATGAAQPVAQVGPGSIEPTDSEVERISPRGVRLVFFVPELPFLTGVEFRGSRLLSQQQIDKLLTERKLTPRLGEPENRASLLRAGKEIQGALRELGHPQARVTVKEQFSEPATVHVRFEINEGPHVPVGQVKFKGNPAISEKRLRGQMREIQPSAFFAGLRGKDAFTPERFAQDREHLLTYYQNHGYPEARIGAAETSQYQETSWKWLPWPHQNTSERLAIEVPVEAGALYRFSSVQASDTLQNAATANRKSEPVLNSVQAGEPYSAQAVENLRRAWQAQIRSKFIAREGSSLEDNFSLRTVESNRTPDATAHTMQINFHLSDSPPYTVRRLQFIGMKKFPDSYFRKRIVLKEGTPLDDRALEAGIARLGRTGYFKPIKREDVHVATNDATHTADVTIRVEELGKQRFALDGGMGQFGSTIGLAYILYNLLDREEVITSRIEVGPEFLQLAMGFAKEGFLGSRGTLALSVFNNILRPALMGTTTGPFYNQRTAGVSADWRYALSPTDTLSVDLGVSRSRTQYSLALPANLAGLPATDVAANTSSHAIGLGWERNTGSERITFADSVSGGLLGGSENLLRTRAEYGRIFHDRLFNSQNAWAFRTSFNAVGSYSGDMPAYARWFAGDQFVRGLNDGELGPTGVVTSVSPTGATTYSAAPAGANVISAVNMEYRMPLRPGLEAATFFDVGSGRLLPNWLGPDKPSIIDSTNRILHVSSGVELRWTVPGVGVPVRVYYAFNLLRLHRTVFLPDGSIFKVSNRFSMLGWGLGSMF